LDITSFFLRQGKWEISIASIDAASTDKRLTNMRAFRCLHALHQWVPEAPSLAWQRGNEMPKLKKGGAENDEACHQK
jgi:hypothetical protein